MSNFQKLPADDGLYLIVLIGFSAISFLPFWRGIEVAGLSMLGWWMVFLMVYVPTSALIHFARSEKKRGQGGGKR